MTSQNPDFPAVPADDEDDEVATREVDGEEVLDADANDDLIDSADADRLAAEHGDDDPGDDDPGEP